MRRSWTRTATSERPSPVSSATSTSRGSPLVELPLEHPPHQAPLQALLRVHLQQLDRVVAGIHQRDVQAAVPVEVTRVDVAEPGVLLGALVARLLDERARGALRGQHAE